MSCDHRVIDGAVGAKFLQTFKQIMENPFVTVRTAEPDAEFMIDHGSGSLPDLFYFHV